MVEERLIEVGDRSVEIIEERKKILRRNEHRVKNLWNSIKQFNVCDWCPRKRKWEQKKISEQIVAKNIPEVLKNDLQIQEAQEG